MYACTFRDVVKRYSYCKHVPKSPQTLCEYRVTVRKKKSKGLMIGGVGFVYVMKMKPVLSLSFANFKIGLVLQV